MTERERVLIIRQNKLRKQKQKIMVELKEIEHELLTIFVIKKNKLMESL